MEKLNPFDDVAQTLWVLKNSENQYSLWPDFSAIPQGWEAVFGPAARTDCINWLELTRRSA